MKPFPLWPPLGLAPASTSLRAVAAGFLPRLVELPRLMADVGCDEDLIARRVPEISRLCKALEDIA